jgi:hypothetical protein
MTREKYMRRVVAQQPFTQSAKLFDMLATIETLFHEVSEHSHCDTVNSSTSATCSALVDARATLLHYVIFQ